jgi:DNA-binding phage protein
MTVKNKNHYEVAKSLGLGAADALEWEVRNLITEHIINVVNRDGITVTKLAKDSGTSRARITRILKEDSIGISLDVLFRVLGATGSKVKLSFPKAS